MVPPFVRDKLKLSDKQEKQIEDLEKEARDGLAKVLSEEQRKKLEEAMKRGPGNGPPDGKDKPKPEGKGALDPKTPTGGIQWYATLSSGREEAQRSGRPILLVSAAPHCGGVSGMW